MKKVLIVEDDEVLSRALSIKLTKGGFTVKIAKNGRDGLSLFKKFGPQLILLDIIMPVMDGLAMLKELRQDRAGKKVPVIVLTNLSEAEKTAEALEQGVHEYLVKTDWKLDDILKLVNSRLNKK
jgi:DNA-binding response OmpR family regulator